MKAVSFAALSLILAASMYLVPYLLLGGLARLEASYAYWIACAALHVALTYTYLKRRSGLGG